MRKWLIAWAILVATGGLLFWGEQQFTYLAESFLGGKTYFMEKPGTWADAVKVEDKYYWPLGILPVMMMVPGVALINNPVFFRQGTVQLILVLIVGLMIYRSARKKGFSKNDSVYWVLAYCMGSAFLGVSLVPWSWYFAQVITVFLMWLIWSEYEGRRRYFLIGLGVGGLALVRMPAALVVVYFGLELLTDNRLTGEEKIKQLLWLGMPVTAALGVWGGYNFIRFGNWFDQGYKLAQVPGFIQKACSYGLFGIIHLPANLYYLLLAGPRPVYLDGVSKVLAPPYVVADPWGMSVFLTSPYLLWLTRYRHGDRKTVLMWLTAGLISIPILTYCGIGFRQFGYRYGLDFFTVVFWILMHKMAINQTRLGTAFKRVVAIGAIINFYFFLTVYGRL